MKFSLILMTSLLTLNLWAATKSDLRILISELEGEIHQIADHQREILNGIEGHLLQAIATAQGQETRDRATFYCDAGANSKYIVYQNYSDGTSSSVDQYKLRFDTKRECQDSLRNVAKTARNTYICAPADYRPRYQEGAGIFSVRGGEARDTDVRFKTMEQCQRNIKSAINSSRRVCEDSIGDFYLVQFDQSSEQFSRTGWMLQKPKGSLQECLSAAIIF